MDRAIAAAPPPPTNADASAQNLARLLQLRWIAIAGQTLTIAIVHSVLRMSLPVAPLAIIIGSLFAWNAMSWWHSRIRERAGNGALVLEILVDIGAFSGLLYFTGGSTNPFVSLYLLPLIIAATLLPPAATWGFAGLTVLCYTLLLFCYVPLPMDHEDGGAFSLHVFGMWLNFVLSATLVAWFVVRMAASIRNRDRLLAQANERALRNEKVVALGTFAAGAAHELGTPLATIAVLARDLEADCRESARREDLRVLRAQVEQCKRIISGLLSATGRARAEDAHPQPVDAFLQGVVEQWRAAIQQLGGRLDLVNREDGGAATRVVLPLHLLRTERCE